MDEMDRASELAEMYLQDQLRQRKQFAQLLPSGVCHHCESGLQHSQQLFCDSECEAEFVYFQQRRIANRGKQ